MAVIRSLINGRNGSDVDIADRGLQYGDGLFETVRVQNGTPLFLELHLERMASGCGRLRLNFHHHNLLIEEARRFTAGLDQGVLKIILTRGSGGRGYRFDPDQCANRILSLHQAPDYSPELAENGVQVRWCATELGINPSLAGIKHLNRLEQVLARSEWTEPGIHEGLMCDSDGFVVEGTMTNLFFVKHGRLFTPDVSYCGVAGVMRRRILELAGRAGIAMEVSRLHRADIGLADELFLTNSVIEIWPVAGLEGHAFNVGPVTRQLQSLVRQQRESKIGQ